MIRSARSQNEEETLGLISVQFSIVYDAIRSLVYCRELQGLVTEGEKFWITTKSAHLQNFVTSWSKCFGSSREDTHWKKSILVKSEFKRKLRLHLGMNARGYEKYIKSVLAVRNKALSHTDLSLSMIYIPNMDLALESLVFLHHSLREELDLLKNLSTPILFKGPLSLEKWIENLKEESGKVIQTAHASTKGMSEYQ